MLPNKDIEKAVEYDEQQMYYLRLKAIVDKGCTSLGAVTNMSPQEKEEQKVISM